MNASIEFYDPQASLSFTQPELQCGGGADTKKNVKISYFLTYYDSNKLNVI